MVAKYERIVHVHHVHVSKHTLVNTSANYVYRNTEEDFALQQTVMLSHKKLFIEMCSFFFKAPMAILPLSVVG